MAVTNHDVATALREIGTLLELTGANPFKTRAYETAARHIEGLGEDVAALAAEGGLEDLPGVGESLAAKITELVETGELAYLDDLRKKVPEGLLEMLRIPDLGPKKVARLWQELGITTVADLERAARNGELHELDGFGKKTEANILEGLDLVRRASARTLLGDALPMAEHIVADLGKVSAVDRIELAGSLRRRRETVKDVDVLVTSANPDAVMDALAGHDLVERVTERGSTKMSVLLTNLMNLDLRVVPKASFAAALQYFTGSADHNIALRNLAKKHDLKISEYGLFDGGKNLHPKTEAALYKRLGLAPIEPELREDTGEIEAAARDALPDLVSLDDCKGVIHAHTVASDGHATLEEMAAAARDLGYSYLVICEHSGSASYANGLTADRLREHVAAIRALDEKLTGFRLLAGTEADILADGSLDYPDDLLAELDVVIASVHSRFKMTGEEMTDRIITAMRNPYVHVVGHLTGRLLLKRDPYPVDQERVIEAAADLGVILEINAHPSRLDLDWQHTKIAVQKGVKVAVCPDAHDTAGLAHMRFGLTVARRGWCEPADVVNTLTARRLVTLCRTITADKS